jgi:hypothetical protein
MAIFIEGYVICKLLLDMYVKVTPLVLSTVILQYKFPDDGPRTAKCRKLIVINNYFVRCDMMF